MPPVDRVSEAGQTWRVSAGPLPSSNTSVSSSDDFSIKQSSAVITHAVNSVGAIGESVESGAMMLQSLVATWSAMECGLFGPWRLCQPCQPCCQ